MLNLNIDRVTETIAAILHFIRITIDMACPCDLSCFYSKRNPRMVSWAALHSL